jgi:hypothetical protein
VRNPGRVREHGDGRDAEAGGLARGLDGEIDRQPLHPRHGRDRLAPASPSVTKIGQIRSSTRKLVSRTRRRDQSARRLRRSRVAGKPGALVSGPWAALISSNPVARAACSPCRTFSPAIVPYLTGLLARPYQIWQLGRKGAGMDFELSEDQAAFRDVASAFAAEHMAPHAAQVGRGRGLSARRAQSAAELGFAGLYVRDDVGGSGLSRMDAAIVFEALAGACPSTAAFLSIHNMASWMIDAYGSEDQRQRFLPGLTAMDLVASYCLTEPGSGSDAAALKTKAVRDGDHYVLNGSKAFISGGGVSDCYVTMVRTGEAGADGISLHRGGEGHRRA